jgi:hypothetical protein
MPAILSALEEDSDAESDGPFIAMRECRMDYIKRKWEQGSHRKQKRFLSQEEGR